MEGGRYLGDVLVIVKIIFPARPCLHSHKNIYTSPFSIDVFFLCFRKALLNVGEVEKPAEPGAKQPPQQTATAGNCGCNKSCNCTKAAVAFSDLYSTGTKPTQ